MPSGETSWWLGKWLENIQERTAHWPRIHVWTYFLIQHWCGRHGRGSCHQHMTFTWNGKLSLVQDFKAAICLYNFTMQNESTVPWIPTNPGSVL